MQLLKSRLKLVLLLSFIPIMLSIEKLEALLVGGEESCELPFNMVNSVIRQLFDCMLPFEERGATVDPLLSADETLDCC